LATLAHFDLVSTGAQIHLVLITLIIHTKSLFKQLANLKKKQISQNTTTTKPNGSEKPHRRRNFYSKFDDLQLYTLANYFFTVVNQVMGFTVAFILMPGFALDVTANYMVLQMYLINAVFGSSSKVYLSSYRAHRTHSFKYGDRFSCIRIRITWLITSIQKRSQLSTNYIL
jgi:hypothetical protein